MKSRVKTWIVVALVTVAVIGPAMGCTQWLLATGAASFGAGWFLRDLTMPTTTETVCYRNDELVDCSEMEP